MNAPGRLRLSTQAVSLPLGGEYRMIVDAKLEGAPVVPIGDYEVRMLPEWAVAQEGDLLQIGELVLRSTHVRDLTLRATYYYLVEGGLEHWLLWRAGQALQRLWISVILTLAVWGLAAYPREGSIPTWRDVIRRWHP